MNRFAEEEIATHITPQEKRMETYISLILTVFLALWSYYNPTVIIQKETEYHTINVIEPLTETKTITSTVTATV